MQQFNSGAKAMLMIGLVLVVIAGVVGVWTLQGSQMQSDFIAALRAGHAADSSNELRDKVWSEEELETAEVIVVPDDTGVQRAIARSLHDRGRIVISGLQYSYQATIEDGDTKIVHVFGFQRQDPQKWHWVTIHPSSMEAHLKRRQEQVESFLKAK